MSDRSDARPNAADALPADFPVDLGDRLSRLDESELRAVISYARTLLPEPPTVDDLLEERPGENILDVEERDDHTKIVKTQPCVEGCEECPHGPYLYHVRVERHPREKEPSLHWTFVGPVEQ